MSRIVIFVFAGREENMSIQMPYLHRLLDIYPQAELHLWDLTRKASDAAYLREVETERPDRITVRRDLHPGYPIRCAYPRAARRPRGHRRCTCIRHKPPYEAPYQWYAEHGDPGDVYVKIDDDVLFLETERFNHMIDPLTRWPNRIISAMVVNNAVCAKYNKWLWSETANHFAVGDPDNPINDARWWALHCNPEFARMEHTRFLDSGLDAQRFGDDKAYYDRTRPGEAISINCIAFTQSTMQRLAPMMSDRLGDEGAVDRLLPWTCHTFRAAHLTFGPQDAAMSPDSLDAIRQRYDDLRKDYLS